MGTYEGGKLVHGTVTPEQAEILRRAIANYRKAKKIRYFDVGCLVATFLTDLVGAAELLKGTGLTPVPQGSGGNLLHRVSQYGYRSIQ
jgi:hypothetical protein